MKRTTEAYITFVAGRRLRYSDLSANFVALGLRTQIIEAGQSRKPTLHSHLATMFMSGLSARSDINVTRVREWYVNSNLNVELLREICCLLGLDPRGYLIKQPLLDGRLLRSRNLVAHGQNIEVDFQDYVSLHDEIILLSDKFRTDVMNVAVTESYRL